MHLQLSRLLTAAAASPEQTLRSSKDLRRHRDMASRVAALLLLGLICFQLAGAQVPVDCCLSVSVKRLVSKNLVSYTVQEAGKGCDISATVFTNKQDMKLCVAHPDGEKWVQKLIKILDKKKGAQQ